MLDPNQALLTGNVAGLLLRIKAELDEFAEPQDIIQTVELEVDEQGNYTNKIFVCRPSGKYEIVINQLEKSDKPTSLQRT